MTCDNPATPYQARTMRNPESQPPWPDTAEIAAQVQTHGWSVATIFEGDEDIGVPFAYSIGLRESFRAPEIIITGLPAASAAVLINMLGDKLRDGARLPTDAPLNDLLDGGLTCILKRIPPGAVGKLGLAYAYYRDWNFEVIQCVWPDREGRFPWEAGCATAPSDQPLLFEA
jgi:hypothetical protein